MAFELRIMNKFNFKKEGLSIIAIYAASILSYLSIFY